MLEALREDNTSLVSRLSEAESRHEQLITAARAEANQQLQQLQDQLSCSEQQLKLSNERCEALSARVAEAEKMGAELMSNRFAFSSSPSLFFSLIFN